MAFNGITDCSKFIKIALALFFRGATRNGFEIQISNKLDQFALDVNFTFERDALQLKFAGLRRERSVEICGAIFLERSLER